MKQSNGLEFFYDNTGVAGVKYNNETFVYRKNVQGDVVAILDDTGKVVVKYTYDAWGNHAVADGNGNTITDETNIGHINPFRYRGYYYDTETELYFLKTRYYDPEIGRFMTIDGISYVSEKAINGLNLYAYCGNNPVMCIDPNGCFLTAIEDWFDSVGDAISDFFTQTAWVVNNAVESFYFNAGAGWGIGIGVDVSPMFSFELMMAEGGALEALPFPQIGQFEKVLVSLNIIQIINLSYGVDEFTAVGEPYDANKQPRFQDFTIGVGMSAFIMLGGYWEFGFNVSQFSRLMGW